MSISKNHARGLVWLHSLSLLVVIVAFVGFSKSTSEEYSYTNDKSARIAITGFTNLNQWSMETDSITCKGGFVFQEGELQDISSLTFSAAVKSLKSSHVEMDSIVYQILSAKGAKDITFVQTRQMVLPKMRMVNIIGHLTMANVTRTVDLQLAYTLGENKELHFKGLKKIDLSQFGVTRAHPLLRTVKFDNQILVQIEMTLNNNIVM
jgi:hypothetical protein